MAATDPNPTLPVAHPRLEGLTARLAAFRRQMLAVPYLLLFAWVAYGWAQTVLQVERFYIPLPVWDDWTTVEHLAGYLHFDPHVFWAQHNEHRIFFPKLVFALDYAWDHGRQRLPLVASVAAYFAMWVGVCWSLLAGKRRDSLETALAMAVSGVIIGWRGSALSLGIPFLVQWSLLECSVVAALFFLYRSNRSRRPVFLWLTIGCAVFATYSSGNGMLLWPILLGIALLLRFSRRDLLTLLGAGVLSIGLYFIGYQRGDSLNLLGMVTHPVYATSFVATYLSIPFGVRHYGTLGGAASGVRLGLFNAGLLVLLLVIAWRKRLVAAAPVVVLLGFSVFVLGSALLVAGGRMNPADPMYIAATASRYSTLPLANWGVLAAAAVWMAAQTRWRLWLPGLVAAALLVFASRNFTRLQAGSWVQVTTGLFADQQWATLSTENDLLNRSANGILFVDPNPVPGFVKVLREAKLSIFYRGEAEWLGQSLASRFPRPPQAEIPGAIAYTEPLESGWETAGWYYSANPRADSQNLVLVDEHGRIVGLGRRLGAGFPVHLRSALVPPTLAFVGFVNPRFGSHSFRAYLVDQRGRDLAPVGVEQALPPLRSAAQRDAARDLPVKWSITGDWQPNLVPKLDRPSEKPSNGFLSSWAGSDQATGTVISDTLATPRTGCLIWPVMHGPIAEEVSAQVTDAETGRVVVSLPLHDHDGEWHYWRAELPPGVKQIRFEASDRGRSWGEWIAVGSPAECR